MSSFFFRLFLSLFIFTSAAHAFADGQWYFDHTGIRKALSVVDSSPDVSVAVIDMNFSLDNFELGPVYDLKASKDFSNNNFVIRSDGSFVEHGSMAVGLIVGIAKPNRVIAINLAELTTTKNLAETLKYAVDSGAKVINCSITAETRTDIDVLGEAIQYAADHDVLIVASAGNGAYDNDTHDVYPANFSREFSNVISVGGSNSQDEMWSHSQYGLKSVDLFSPAENILIFATPGRHILSEGTSEAAPITTGVAVLMRQANPKLKASDIKRLLIETADKLPAFKDKCVSGGRINAYAAVLAAINQ